jgi:hypothetical protein
VSRSEQMPTPRKGAGCFTTECVGRSGTATRPRRASRRDRDVRIGEFYESAAAAARIRGGRADSRRARCERTTRSPIVLLWRLAVSAVISYRIRHHKGAAARARAPHPARRPQTDRLGPRGR